LIPDRAELAGQRHQRAQGLGVERQLAQEQLQQLLFHGQLT
jgi:hypothetical protein